MAKQGLDLQALAAELTRRKETSKDYIATQSALSVEPVENGVNLTGINGTLAIRPYAHAQLADTLGIPKRYYDRCLAEKPALLADNVNTWLHSKPTEKRLVRTLDGQARAFLSSSYRPLDNFDLAEAVLPVLVSKGAQVISSDLTETRLYIKAILPGLSGEVPRGMTLGEGHNRIKDTVVAALTISNSEVGAGAVRVEPSVFTTWCTNLAIIRESSMKKYHLGRDQGLDFDQAIEELLRDETKSIRDKAFWQTVKDVVESAFAEDRFRFHVERLSKAAEDPIKSENLPKVVELVTSRLSLPPAVNNSVLLHLTKGGDLSKWGLSSAITSAANTAPDYELATQLERAGGDVIELGPNDWRVISEAA